MATLANRAKMNTATTGAGTIALNVAIAGYQSFAAAGVTNGQIVDYVIEDGSAWEIGTGVYTSAGTTLTRSVIESTNSNAAINLSGAAVVMITPYANDIRIASLGFAISDETTAITTGTSKLTAYIMRAFNCLEVVAGLSAQSTSGAPAFDINKNGVSIFSTTVTIDANEDTSLTAAT